MTEIDYQAEANKPWAQIVKEREIRECRKCGAVIANHRDYGRPPQPSDSNLCECCPPIRYCHAPYLKAQEANPKTAPAHAVLAPARDIVSSGPCYCPEYEHHDGVCMGPECHCHFDN